MKTLSPHLNILPQTQKDFLPNLASCKYLGFTLYGGTALALQLGHRVSIDFDFFSNEPLDHNKESALLDALPFLTNAKPTQHVVNTRSYLTDSGVSFSFFGNINFGRVGTPLITEDGILQVASLEDLMATKLAVVQKRVESKDYQDIAALLRHGISLANGLGYAQALYGEQFAPSECVKVITYFEGGDLESLSQRDKEVLVDASKKLQLSGIPKIPIVSKDLTCPPFPKVMGLTHDKGSRLGR